MAHHQAIKALTLSPRSRRKSESLFWNVSGSTLLHILVILGLGFYVSQPEPMPPKRSLAINLVPNSELSAETRVGSGAPHIQADAQPDEPKHREVLHVDEQETGHDKQQLQLTPQSLIDEIKEINTVIEKSERVGFLGVYDVHPSYRQYQQYWQNYVSEFGTKNYPHELIKLGLNGTLELDIAIDRNGNVRSAEVYRSSGNPVVDQAALRVATEAGPYAPLPEEMTQEIDILHIIRTWEFKNNTLTSRAGSHRGS